MRLYDTCCVAATLARRSASSNSPYCNNASACSVSVALTMTGSFVAAHIAFARFEPMLSSKPMADTIMSDGTANDTLIIYGEQSSGSSVIFYTNDFFREGQPMLVLPRCGQNSEGTTLLWGSCYPDAPDIY